MVREQIKLVKTERDQVNLKLEDFTVEKIASMFSNQYEEFIHDLEIQFIDFLENVNLFPDISGLPIFFSAYLEFIVCLHNRLMAFIELLENDNRFIASAEEIKHGIN